MSHSEYGEALIKHIPRLRAYAYSLTGSRSKSDDLVQDTLIKAWSNSASFEEGTNLRAWLVTIMRNTFLTQYKRGKREVEDIDGQYANTIAVDAEQPATIHLHDVQSAISKLPNDQQEILLMIGVAELSYEEASEIAGIPVGTVKSRLNRARAKLAEHLGMISAPETSN